MIPLLLNICLLLAAAIVIYISCEYFVNGVEWVGHRLAVGQQATGSILAAFGTALPESAVTFIAVVFGTNLAQKQIGVGAALGGPLALSTIAYATVGVMLLAGHRSLPEGVSLRKQFQRLSHDQGWFLAIFIFNLVLGLVAFAWKPWLGIFFLLAYAAYFRKEIMAEPSESEGELEALKLTPHTHNPATWIAIAQTLVALVVIFLASHFFVTRLELLGDQLGLSAQLVALLFSPVATELPEVMNAVIWVRQGKYKMALANISGSMMIQATVPSALGIFFTSWVFNASLIVAACITMAAIIVMFIAFRGGFISRWLLAAMGGFYMLFALWVIIWQLN